MGRVQVGSQGCLEKTSISYVVVWHHAALYGSWCMVVTGDLTLVVFVLLRSFYGNLSKYIAECCLSTCRANELDAPV